MQKPPFLQKGDTVGIVALAWKVDFEDLKPAIALLENEWGLNVVLGTSLEGNYFQYAAPDAVRAKDFQEMLDNPTIKAIFSARGGYGSTRIIDLIDFTYFRQNPKWVIGFSDITGVLCHINNFYIESIHGVMPKVFLQENGAISLASLYNVLFGQAINYQIDSLPINHKGKALGQLVGGNLAILVHIIGTASEADFSGKILFIEDVGEHHYAIDRMMVQLKRTGILAKLAGLIVGHFSDLLDSETLYGKNAHQIINEAVADYQYPVCFGFPVGHEAQNWALPLGREVCLTVLEQHTTLTETIA
ncbi:S66 peptidase family protein [Flectobacillus major]|uniref:S66 peptidase family protein n=1 Tax=Flectobacillus major TaxID=103 RepID=UPI000429D40E|nr:LD-carboxypeptidase [Flectobacillus major]